MTPLSYHLPNLSLTALETMRLLVQIFQFFAFEHKINKSNAKVSTTQYRIITNRMIFCCQFCLISFRIYSVPKLLKYITLLLVRFY